MGEKLIVGPFNRGLRTDREPFVIDNDSFPTLQNAYQWRGRVKRKRGTSFLGRLQRTITSTDLNPILTFGFGWTNLLAYIGLSPKSIFITNITQAAQAVVTYTFAGGLDYSSGQNVKIVGVAGMTQINNGIYKIVNKVGNQLTLNVDSTAFSPYAGGGIIALEGIASIVPGSINFTDGVNTYTDPPPQTGILSINGVPNSNTFIDYTTGIVNLNQLAPPVSVTGSFAYYPDLPVMGLEDLAIVSTQFPGTLAFDTTYSYNIKTTSPFPIYDVSFYKNPASPDTSLPGYISKGTWTPTTWNGQNYQQFWTTNYQGALWATNGIDTDPVTLSKIGMQFKPIITGAGAGVTVISGGPPAIARIAVLNHGLVVGDFVFINEVGPGVTGINYQTGYVITVISVNQIDVEFPNATLAGSDTTGGIVQYLTNRSDPTKDCLRWYDGDPTNGVSPLPSTNKGWVNFTPPLNNFVLFPFFSIADLPPDQYYLVGARMITPFKDRLLFMGPVIQTSSGTPIYLQDTVIFSQNGTPYYTASFTGDPSLATTLFHPILVPDNQTASPVAYWEDLAGFGGFISAGVEKPILTVGNKQDVLIVGFSTIQTKLVDTGDGITPFNFYSVNSDLGSGSTFSTINLDNGVLTRGNRGYIVTTQTGAQRFDEEILDQVFQINLSDHGSERFTAQRDFVNEWIYFTYPANDFATYAGGDPYTFPNQTLFYNYRDQSWSIYNEAYTTYGQFRKASGDTWNDMPVWNMWHDPWDSGSITVLNPDVIAGNQQGFVMIREDERTSEGTSLYIQGFLGNTVTSPNHCLNNDDYVILSGIIGTLSSINGSIFQISNATANTFNVDAFPILSGTYLGGGLITRMYIPFFQTKQFPVNWATANKTRLGPQQYLLSTTDNAQVTLLIFLSQNDESAYNAGNIVPELNTVNSSLIYSTVLYTCSESTNLGLLPASGNMLNPANTNLQMVTASAQEQTWHRINTSLIGDTVQLGFILSDAQMRTLDNEGNFVSQFEEIEIHGFILDVSPSMVLA